MRLRQGSVNKVEHYAVLEVIERQQRIAGISDHVDVTPAVGHVVPREMRLECARLRPLRRIEINAEKTSGFEPSLSASLRKVTAAKLIIELSNKG